MSVKQEGSGLRSRLARRNINWELWSKVLSPLAVLVLWEIAAQGGIIDDRFFPPPTRVLSTMVELTLDGMLIQHTLVSLGRVLPAFFVGSALGIACGLLMGWSNVTYSMFDPIVSLLYPIPRVALLPIIFVLFGLSEFSRMFAIAMAVFLNVVITTLGGAREVKEEYIEAARDNGASQYQILREVLLPASLPGIFAGLSLGIIIALLLILVIEMTAADVGLGTMIWDAWELFAMEEMYAGIVTINLIGIVFLHGTEEIGNRLTHWHDE